LSASAPSNTRQDHELFSVFGLPCIATITSDPRRLAADRRRQTATTPTSSSLHMTSCNPFNVSLLTPLPPAALAGGAPAPPTPRDRLAKGCCPVVGLFGSGCRLGSGIVPASRLRYQGLRAGIGIGIGKREWKRAGSVVFVPGGYGWGIFARRWIS
jgi:hypothetical protein